MGLLSFLKRGEVDDGDKPAKPAKPAKAARASVDAVDDVQQLRLRARRRLIGAAVLVGVAVIVFPLLFETQPRPIPVDLPIDIPKKDGVAPLNVPATAGKIAKADETPETGRGIINETAEQAAGDRQVPPPEALREPPRDAPDPAVRDDVKPDAKARIAEPARGETRPEAHPKPVEAPKVARAEPRPEPKDIKPEAKPEPKAEAKPDRRAAGGNESARVQAMLDGHAADRKAAEAAAGGARFIVQVGAYADAKAAQDARAKVERMGLKTYTQAVETADGKRIRVRVGPFDNRNEADKVAAKVRGGGLSSAVLTL